MTQVSKFNQSKFNGAMSSVLDFVPIVLFFICFKYYNTFGKFWIFKSREPIIFASFVLAISTFLSIFASIILKVKLNKFNTASSIIVVLFAGLTVIFNNPQFVKIKITIINAGFAVFIYLYCLIKKDSLVKIIFAGKIEMLNHHWLVLDKRFFYLFLTIATANEICWRLFSTHIWVNYKVFVVLPLSLLFFAFQMPFLYRHSNLSSVSGIK